MNWRRVKNVLFKEWLLLFTDINSVLMSTLLPLLIVGQVTLYIWLANTFGGEAILKTPLFQSALEKVARAIPAAAGLSQLDLLKVMLLNQSNLFLLLIPTMVAVNVATFSIVDEKITGSLEALLATPVRTGELLLGKALAGAIPALIVTWISAGFFLLVTALMGWGTFIGFIVNGSWFFSMFLLTPAVAVLSFMLGVIGSSRAKDAKSAQNLSVIIILPVLGLIAVQVIGIIWFTPLLTFVLALVIGAIDYVVLRVAVRLFQRESIIIQWR